MHFFKINNTYNTDNEGKREYGEGERDTVKYYLQLLYIITNKTLCLLLTG